MYIGIWYIGSLYDWKFMAKKKVFLYNSDEIKKNVHVIQKISDTM